MSEANRHILSIFCAALDHEAATEQAAYLDEACGHDADLRGRVDALLRAHRQAGNFLHGESSASSLSDTTAETLRGVPGDTLGPYKLLEPLGEGGFGIVFLAEQQEPIRRKVALKVLKAGVGSRDTVARFEAERQALALMDHPNIAKVLEAGTTGAGQPYFAMEWVRGLPITDYCDQNKLTIGERLTLFASVCCAVQHAHTKGIIHRDIKPSNVLVTLHSGVPVVKVIDFGIAKALGQRLTDKTLHTGVAQLVGTPLYMSPEQAGLGSQDVDTRSDVYSLGVLLYELLTGSTPLDLERLRGGGHDEWRRILREEEPAAPSTRVRRLGTAAAEVSARRKSDPRRLSESLRRELDWIALKALEKDSGRRYQTPGALAADVQHYLDDEAVQACPPSALYRLGKLARRNKRALATLALLGLMLLTLVGVVAGTVGWVLRDRAARQAKLEDGVQTAVQDGSTHADRALTLIHNPAQWEAALIAAFSALERAEGLAASAEELLDPALRERMRALAARLEADEKDRRMVSAVERIRLEGSQLNVKERQFANAGASAARYRDAFESYGMPVTAPPEEAAAMLRGKHAAIRAALVGALDGWLMWTSAGTRESTWLATVLAAADTDTWRNRVRAALRKYSRQPLEALAEHPEAIRQSPATLVILANALHQRQARQSAIRLLRRAQVRYSPDFWLEHTLALQLMQGKWGPESTIALSRVGSQMEEFVDPTWARAKEAVASYRVALALRPDNPGVYTNLGNALHMAGDLPGAVAAHKRAIALAPDYASAYANLGNALMSRHDLSGAIAAYRKAIALAPNWAYPYTNLGNALHARGDLDGAIARYKQALPRRKNYATPHNNIGLVLVDKGDLPGAIAAYRKAIRINPKYATAHSNLGNALNARGDLDAAIAEHRKAVACDPDLALAHYNLGNALHARKDFPGASAAYRKAIDLAPKWALAHYNLGVARQDDNDLPGAIAAYRKAVALKPDLAAAHNNLGRALEDRGNLPGAIAAFEHAITARRKARDHGGKLANAYYNLGNVLVKTRDPAGASAAYRKAIAAEPKHVMAHVNLGVALHAAGDGRGALAALERAVTLDPRCAKAHINIGYVLHGRRDLPGAVRAYRKAIDCDPKSALARSNLGRTLFAQGKLDDAEDQYRAALRCQPGFAIAHNNLGLVLKARGDLEGAVAEFEKALRSQPGYLDALLNLGSGLSQLGAYAEAAFPLAKAMKLQPRNPFPWFYQALTELGAGRRPAHRRVCAGMLKQLGKTRNPLAANLVLYACVSTPDASPADLLPLARVAAARPFKLAHVPGAALYRAGKYEAAERSFEAAARGVQLRALDHYFLAMVRHRLGKPREARQALDRGARWLEAAQRQQAGKKQRPLPWFFRVAVEHLRREAETLLGSASPAEPAPKKKAPPSKP
jgi:tetratricopeptide (TPR) repeat protein